MEETKEFCQYCGKELERATIKVNGRIFTCGFVNCDCDGAQEELRLRKELDEQLRIEEHQRKLRRKIAEARIPKRYRDAYMEDDDTYMNAINKGLYIYGDVGNGKTTKACAVGIRAIDEGYSVLFVKAYEISDLPKEDLERIPRVDLLIIDDLGAGNTNEWGNTKLRAAIDRRYDSMMPVIVTSNYSKDQLKKVLLRNVKDMTPKSIISRLNEMTDEIKVEGEDMRK